MIKRSCASLTHSALENPCKVASTQSLAPFLQATTSLLPQCLLNTRHASKNLGGWGWPQESFGKIVTCLLTVFKTVALSEPILLPGDADGDGFVGFEDFARFAQCFGKVDATLAEGDFDGDGVVSFDDFAIFTQHFGQRLL